MTDIFFVNNYVNKWREEGGKIPRELVNQLRQRMLNHVADHDDKFDQRDILQLANGDDWTVERYILEHGDSKKENLGDEPFHRLKSCLLWRKIIGINDLNKSTFPRQFFRSGLIRLYGSDLNGGRVLLIRANIYQPVPEAWDELFFKYLAFWAEKADLANTLGHGVTVLIDTDKMDYDRSFRMNLLVFFRNLIHEWYPKLVSVIVLHKLPGKFSHRDIHLRVKQCFKDVHNMQVIVSKQNYQLTLCKLMGPKTFVNLF